MPAKDGKKGTKTPLTEKSSIYGEIDILPTPRSVNLSLLLAGDGLGPGDWIFLTIFNGQVVIETKWQNGLKLNSDALPLDLKKPQDQQTISEHPLLFIVRTTGSKGTKDPDPLLNLDNRAGASVDLFPLLLGEEQIFLEVPILFMNTGLKTDCAVKLCIKSEGQTDKSRTPLMLTMLSVHCLPPAREGTVYISAIGMNGLCNPYPKSFGMSLSNADAKKIVWASASNAGLAANTAFNIPIEDKFISADIEIIHSDSCISFYWNAMKRVLVDPIKLRERLASNFLVEIAGVPRVGKIDVRGRYMALVDAKVLLEPGQFGVTTCARLLYFNEADLPDGVGGLLDLPPTSAKISVRDTGIVTDEYGHAAYVIIRLDLFHPLIPKAKLASLFELIGFPPPQDSVIPVDDLYSNVVTDDYTIDVRQIRKEGGAISVHKELCHFACKGSSQMTQSIKRTAANRLLVRIRSMLKQYPLGDCLQTEWQDIVSAQHAACRRAVTSSFAPQPPGPRPSSRVAAARSRLAGDERIANNHIEKNLDATSTSHHPRPLLAKVLRCLEGGNDSEAHNYILKALNAQVKNRYLLWIYGGMEFDRDSNNESTAAFRIALKGDTSDGTTCAIGWAALHAVYHYKGNIYAAFVASRKMRKAFELPTEWKKFLQRWVEISGEEEIYWIPGTVDSSDPILLASAFFLCLRCYKFSERLLRCIEEGCVTRGSRFGVANNVTVDIFYIRAASLILRRQYNNALKLTEQGIKKFGPSAMMSQMRAICLTCVRGWDEECESALLEADRAGAEPCPSLLLKAAMGGLKANPSVSLQRAARAHKLTPSAHSALVIGRIYAKLGESSLAERWAAAAVKTEPLLADGWAFLSLLAMYERKVDKAKIMLRTAKQVGPISSDIDEELKKLMKIVPVQTLPDALVKDLCFCEYY